MNVHDYHIRRWPVPALCFVIVWLAAVDHAVAQYSPDVFSLKKAQDLFDERGMGKGAAVSVDGKLAINNQNGGVNYSYTLSSFHSGGHQVVSALNYCSSVQFTAFKDYDLADRETGGLYSGWGMFHQNRPAWIYSVGGWAVNVIATAPHFHAQPGTLAFNTLAINYADSNFLFLIDGYDFSNRMRDFGAVANVNEDYRDVIRILRGDGSVLELLNINRAGDIGYGDPDTAAKLYTGYYFVNEANSRGYGLVEFDTTMLTGSLREHIYESVAAGRRYPVLPRVLRYFAGDGTEAIFREKLAPFGLSALKDFEGRGGGLWGHPTIFYLDEIRSNAGTIVEFRRPRHQRQFDAQGVLVDRTDETRGRALTTSYTNHEIRFGYNSIIIEALGRTTKVKFDTISRNGNVDPGEMMPYANLGGMTSMARDMAGYDEENALLYRSFVGYVTEIQDPEDRLTTFDYESYSKSYQGFGFPHTGSSVTLLLKNYRLKSVTEPAAKYTLTYHGTRNAAITQGVTPLAENLNLMADSVRKFDRFGTLLTIDRYTFASASEVGNITSSTQTITDNATGHTRTLEFIYQSFPLNIYEPILTPGRHTVLTETRETAGDVETVTETSYATAATMSGWGHENFTVLPISQVTTVNGIPRSHQEFYYQLDTLRTYWNDDSLDGKFGMEITRKVTHTMKPDEPAKILLADTTTYLHLPMIDTTLTWYKGEWNKLATLANFFYLRDTVQHADVVGKKWEEVSLRPPVVVYNLDTLVEQVKVPPVFGLEERSWTSDTTGAVTGKRNIYLTDIMQGNQRAQRGLLLADSILGSGGTRLLKGAYEYSREWNGDLLSSTRNALGVESFFSYGYQFCENFLFWQSCNGIDPTGTIVANDSTTRDYKLQWNPFSHWYAKPAAERQVVRRYNAAGDLRRDTLTSYTERTFHGLASATLEPNGYISRYDYDYNGRLNTAWLPYDFAGTGVLDTSLYEGRESVGLLGMSIFDHTVDTLHCWRDPFTDSIMSSHSGGPQVLAPLYDTLYAAFPVLDVPECPCEHGGGPSAKEEDRALQATCDQSIPYTVNLDGYYGLVRYTIDSASPLQNATRIDSMNLELMISSIEGYFVHLEVEIPGIFTENYLFDFDIDSLLEEVPGGYIFRVDLSDVAGDLQALPVGSTIDITLKVQSGNDAVTFVSGTTSEDLRPRLNIYGEFQKIWDRADYTLAYEYNDNSLTTDIKAKVDDARHTVNDLTSQGITVRRSTAKNFFGGDYRHLKTERTVIEPDTTGSIVTRTDESYRTYTGLGANVKSTDALGDTVVTEYDAANRPIETINPDGTSSTIQYIHATADSLGFSDQEFFGYCDATIVTNENGIAFAKFSDAFGRLRREVANYGSSLACLNVTTKYEYDLLGRLVQVINPKGDTTRYTHDEFGRVITKSHPDLGTISYVYDNLGNVRFVQDEEQAGKNLLTYNQYDDLNRPTLIGEAYIDEGEVCGPYNEDNLNSPSCNNGTRLTDSLDGNILHINNYPSILTANATMFMDPIWESPAFTPVEDFQLKNCQLDPEPRLGETDSPVLPLIMHETRMYKPRGNGVTGAWLNEFEDLESFPEFARIGIHYDRMPISSGTLWKEFPLLNIWDRLAPTGKIRNQKGREAAIAYRDKSSEPFHYSVLSYDERGRVEALLRYNENLGFDAVYYQYNSANQVIALTVADPLRKFTTWYGYDHQGRVDTVWTSLEAAGSGLKTGSGFDSLAFPGYSSRQGTGAEIVYSYTKTDQVKRMKYPAINTLVDYAYNSRKFLDSLVARTGSTPVFSQRLSYDPSGQITEQEYRHGSGSAKLQEYDYDRLQRLERWELDGNSESYQYDAIGSRENVTRNTQPIELYAYHSGTNRLSVRTQPNGNGGDTLDTYGYNNNGARTSHLTQYNFGGTGTMFREEYLGYSFRGLNNRARVRNTGGRWQDWRYRYNAMGEREQKRLYEQSGSIVPAPDSVVFPWCYYLLGGNKEQLAVYHGQQFDSLQTECGDVGINRVYLYPFEYITNGVGQRGNLITRPNGTKEYKVADHLGSTRAVLDSTGAIVSMIDNAPFGEQIAVTGVDARKQYIDKEKDRETSTANHGVRQYDPEQGSFTSPDALWEKYRAWSPYNYSGNNSLRFIDPSGLEWFKIGEEWSYIEGRQQIEIAQYNDDGEATVHVINGVKELLLFNGKELTWLQADGAKKSWSGVSGDLKDGKTDPNTQLIKSGPIPEGKYFLDPKDVQKWSDQSTFTKMKSGIGRGTWPGGTSSWGEFRVPILPKEDDRGERTGNYFIHGGSVPGSRGCIDLTQKNNDFFNVFIPHRSIVPLEVDYE